VIDDGGFNVGQWEETRAEHDGAGGRMVLGWALAVLATLWLAYSAWAAGRALGGVPLDAPALAQWIAVVTGPLALLGLGWLMFGRTRRKEAERFTRSVIAMRNEAHSLEGLLAVLGTRIGESHNALRSMSAQLMTLGEETAQRLGGVTRELDEGSQRLSQHGAALDQAASAARTDMGVLLADLPVAEAHAVSMAARLRDAGTDAARQAELYAAQVATLTERTAEADVVVGDASGRLVTHLTHIESASAAARAQLEEVAASHRGEIEGLLGHAADALDQIRRGIDAQAATVAALVAQASAGLGQAGIESAQALGNHLGNARDSLDGLSSRVAEQERASQRLMADLDTGLASLDDRFQQLAQDGDHARRTWPGPRRADRAWRTGERA
jgi:chromosome segregation ATPase